MRILFTAIFLSVAWSCFAQNSLRGHVFSSDGSPLLYSSVVLLNPTDSTMQAFGITAKDGNFDIKNIKTGDYLLQVSFLGYETYYRQLAIPVSDNDLGTLVLKEKPQNVDEVNVVGEYIPLRIKKDTVEYNAAAFKLKSDAVTEDLLKKLPGIEVDRAGNIKAMGEDVKKLFVDGKEFFGNDPKVATKNVPANAVDKVQVYNRKSEEAMFTGIDDGSRDKAINLQLKEDKKSALFGDLTAGGGTGEHWQGNAKAYRFTDKIQVAALGNANNINQFGFSFSDYLNFSGGVGNMIHGGGSAQIRITSDGSFPINFGQPVSGLNVAKAGGANFSYSKNPNNRVFMSYLGSGAKKELDETTKTWNYLQNNEFFQNQKVNETDINNAHNFNFGLRSRIDSTQNIVVDGTFTLGNGENRNRTFSQSFSNSKLINQLENFSTRNSDRISGNANATYLKKLKQGKSVFNSGGNVNFSTGLAENLVTSGIGFFEGNISEVISKFQDNSTDNVSFAVNASVTQKISRLWYIIPEIRGGASMEGLERKQGTGFDRSDLDVLLSPDFLKTYTWFRPKLELKKTTQKAGFSVAVQMETGKFENSLNNQTESNSDISVFLPSLWYEYEIGTGKRVMVRYNSSVNLPNVTQLLPVVNNLNPLSLYYGNPGLKPEKANNVNLHWIHFDQFSFTSVMAALNGTYTRDKINWDRTINPGLTMVNTLANVDADYNLKGNIDFSTPLRRLGVKINLDLEETWNRGTSLINAGENVYTNQSHRASISVDNRKKEKWDVNTGVEARLTTSEYSVQKSLNNTYFDLSWFGEIRFTPNDKWNMEVNADVARYTDKSFGESVDIPLLGAEISRYFLKNKRGTLTLRGFDLLNRNKIMQRFSELNYLREIRSNSIGRYVMLSFTYRLNKFGEAPGGIDIKMKR